MQSLDRLVIDGAEGEGSVFENNSAGRFGGAISVNADWVGAGTFVLDDTVFRSNGAGSAGGAIWIRQTDGNGIRAISDASFLTNAAANGGGLYLEGTAALTRLERVAFCGNDPSNIAGLYSAATTDAVCQTISCQDQNGNGFPDTCEFAFEDCNLNNIPDDEELVGNDINNDRVPDDCQPDLTFAGLSTEIVPITAYVNGLPSSAVCWRIYANFRDRPNADPPLSAVNGSVTAIYGNPAHPLSISSAAGFFQALVPNELNQPVHANTAASIPCATTDDAVRYDSFFTVGAECQGQQTSLQTTPLLSFAQFNAPTNSVLSTNDGAIFVQPDSPSSRAGKDRKVLIMQLTTKSAALPVGNINLRGRADIGAAGIWDAFALPIPAPAYSSQSDCNNNGVHDALDIAAGLRDCNYDGVPDICQGAELRNDCDGDGTPDACEIAAGAATDTNGNGLPDNCECYGDVDQNGSVNVDDLLEVFASWGMSGSGIPADVDGNGIVGPGDIAGVLAGWGGCI